MQFAVLGNPVQMRSNAMPAKKTIERVRRDRRSASERSEAARKAAQTKGPTTRSEAAQKAARTRKGTR
jgi:hypothetical protein